MPVILRYQHAAIMRHLAHQYVVGVMTPLVRRRMEKLLLRYPELSRTVAHVADQMAGIHYQQIFTPTPLSANYAAAMTAAKNSDDVRFMILAYGKTKHSPSRLVMQWSERHSRKALQPLHLWAEHIDTQVLTYIGTEPKQGSPWHLKKDQWQAIKKSGRLLMTDSPEQPNEATLSFQGRCLQLKPWKV
ncbi:MAG: hypothetical protein ACI8P9_003377 [Parasphingorhabdus sp.]|jgi:hypothetical protein